MVNLDDEDDEDDAFDPAANRLPALVEEVFRGAERLLLLRLDPFRRPPPAPDRRAFHAWRATRRLQVSDPAERAAVVGAVEQGLARSDGTFAMCFDPTIGVRARRGRDTVDLVCCFDCNWVQVFAVVGGQSFRCRLLTTSAPFGLLSALLSRTSRLE
jgi:hypothetical protein